MKINLQKQKGFSLIEMIIYVAIFSMLIGTIVIFMNMIYSSRINNQVLLDVNNQGSSIIKTITYNIQNAVSVNTPNISMNNSTLSLMTADINTNPTIFYVTDGILYIKKGGDDEIALNNNKTNINNLVFTNLSNPDTPGVIQIRFTIDGINKNNIIYSSDFYGSSSIRR